MDGALGDGTLTASVAALCRELEGTLPNALAASVWAVRRELARPLRVAVGGGVSAGKSTLVNALLGRRVAEVRAGETRRLTTVYEAAGEDAPESVRLCLADGERVPMELEADGTLPRSDRADGRRWEVALRAPALARLTLVDTPGLFSGDATAQYSEAGERALLGAQDRDTREAMREAEALIYLLGDTVSASDLVLLRRYGVQLAEWGKSGFNAVALIGRADEVRARGRDPFDAAAEQAEAAREALGAAVAAVVPVSSLLAETARTHALSDDDLAALAELAADPPSDRTLDNPTALEARPGMARLTARLSGYGIRVAIRHIAVHGPARGALEAELERRSGLAEVTGLLQRHFLIHADIIKASGALGELQALADRAQGTEARMLSEEVARARRRAEFHRANEVMLYRDVVLGGLRLGDELEAELGPLLALHDVRHRLGLPAGAGRQEVARKLRSTRERWVNLRDDRLQPLAARNAAPIVLETLRRLQHDVGLPPQRFTRLSHEPAREVGG